MSVSKTGEKSGHSLPTKSEFGGTIRGRNQKKPQITSALPSGSQTALQGYTSQRKSGSEIRAALFVKDTRAETPRIPEQTRNIEGYEV